MLGVILGGGHPQAAEGLRLHPLVPVLAEEAAVAIAKAGAAVIAGGIHQAEGDRRSHGSCSRVLQCPAEDGDRLARGICIARDERIERLQTHRQRQPVVFEFDPGERVLAPEPRLLETGQAGDSRCRQTVAGRVGREEAPLQHPRQRHAALGACPDGEEGIRQYLALARPVEDLPVSQLAAPSQRDGARADAAQRKPDLRQRGTGERALGSRIKELQGCVRGVHGGRCSFPTTG